MHDSLIIAGLKILKKFKFKKINKLCRIPVGREIGKKLRQLNPNWPILKLLISKDPNNFFKTSKNHFRKNLIF